MADLLPIRIMVCGFAELAGEAFPIYWPRLVERTDQPKQTGAIKNGARQTLRCGITNRNYLAGRCQQPKNSRTGLRKTACRLYIDNDRMVGINEVVGGIGEEGRPPVRGCRLGSINSGPNNFADAARRIGRARPKARTGKMLPVAHRRNAPNQKWLKVGSSDHIDSKAAVSFACVRTVPPRPLLRS